MYSIVRAIIKIILRLAADVTILGAEHIPAEGGFLLTTNHLSQTDPPLLMIAVPRRIRVFTAEKYRRNPFLRILFDALGCIWVRQFEADHEAVRTAIRHLRSGGIVGMSPEGTRSRETHALIRGQGGASLLASRSEALILPLAVWGTETFFSDLLHFRCPKITARIGKPYRLDISPRARGSELEDATDEIMCAIAALLPPAYRGEYAGHPRLKSRLEREGA